MFFRLPPVRLSRSVTNSCTPARVTARSVTQVVKARHQLRFGDGWAALQVGNVDDVSAASGPRPQ